MRNSPPGNGDSAEFTIATAHPNKPALIWVCVGGHTAFLSLPAKVAGTTSVVVVHSPAVAAGQPVSVALLAKVARVAVSASFVGVTVDELIPPSSEASSA